MFLFWRKKPAPAESNDVVINIAEEFSPVPIGRRRKDGPDSAERFLEELPRFVEAVNSGRKLEISFDGMRGLSASFLEEAFGGLVHHSEYSSEQVLETIKFAREDFYDSFVYAIREYIREAGK